VAAFKYVVSTENRVGHVREHEYASDEELGPGSVVFLAGRYWLLERVEPPEGDVPARASAKAARYRITLVHPDGRVETGAFRRFRADAPRYGHSFTTIEDGRPASWEVVGEQLASDDRGEPYLELRAERDYGEAEGDVPDHELEHALAAREARLPEAASTLLTRAVQEGLSVELVALEPGEEPDWAEAERYIDALIFEEIEDDLFELSGVDTRHDPQERWLAIGKERLREDLTRFRGDIEGDHDEIEEWDFRGGRVFATIGSPDDEANPDSGHGWMCRLVDVSALGAAGMSRIRKSELDAVG
jgi:hypothetical protein